MNVVFALQSVTGCSATRGPTEPPPGHRHPAATGYRRVDFFAIFVIMFRYGFRKHLNDLGVDYGASVLAAVSGGVDSMCMLDALVHCQLDLKIAVAHVNFNLRGEESDADTQMVTQWCREHGITLYKESFNTTEYAAQNGISIEMAARDLRYNWFYSLMQEHGFDFLAIAHNANDNAETLLLNLTRGCGVDGIGGIREKVLLQLAEGEQYIIRPLIPYSRQQIEKYAFKFKVPFRTDSTNLLSDYSRNRIRNEVFPQLEKINPSVVATFNRNIRHFQQAGSILQRVVEEKCAALCNVFSTFGELLQSKFAHCMCGLNLRLNCICSSMDGTSPSEASAEGSAALEFPDDEKYSILVCVVELDKLFAEPEWEFWVYQISSRWGFVAAVQESICKALVEDEGPKRFLSGSGEIIAVKERGLLKFYLNVAQASPLQIDTTVIPVESWRTRKEAGQLCPVLYMDASKLQMPLTCRCVEAGDRFSPLGLRGSKKVTDYLTDIKFENLHKGSVLVMTDASGKIVCLPGLQIANHVRVTESTAEILQVKVL